MKNLPVKLIGIITIANGKKDLDSAIDYLVDQTNLTSQEYETCKEIIINKFSGKSNVEVKKEINCADAPVQWDWFEEADLPEFNWMCSKLGLIPGPVTILSAFSNTGKTFFAASLAICVANGLKFLGEIEIERPGKVLHIDWDQGQKFSQIYYWRLLNGYGIKSFKNIDYFRPSWNLGMEDAEEKLVKIVQGYTFCIIDCLGAAIPEADLNDDRVRKYIDMLNRVSEKTQCSIMLLHHEPKVTGKDPLKSVKGNGSIISAAGGSIHLSKNESNNEINMIIGKKRLVKDYQITYVLEDCGEMSKKLNMQNGLILNKVAPSEENKNSSKDMCSEILEVIKNNPEIGSRELRQQLKGYDNHEIDKIVNDLHEGGFIKIEGVRPKKHSITEEGLTKIAYK